jgi:hypothetical protein
MPRRPSLGASFLACRAFVLSVTFVPAAYAQTLTFATDYVRRDAQDARTTGNNHINLADCEKDDFFTFYFSTMMGVGTLTYIQAWSALNDQTDCTVPAMQTDEASCRQVAEQVRFGEQFFVEVRVRDIVSNDWGPWTGFAPADVCNGGGDDPVNRVLQFFLVSNGALVGTKLTYPVGYDILGPPPPTAVKAGVGESLLVVSWKEPTGLATVPAEYQVFADPVDPGIGGEAGAGNVPSDAGTSTECSSDDLVPGEPPPDREPNGRSNSASTEAEAGGLTNGVRYAVAVSTVDSYLNPGTLSSLDCGTPEPVTGFFEAYRAAGGGGGGGFCAFGARPSGVAAAGAMLAVLGFMIRRARRRTARANGRDAT